MTESIWYRKQYLLTALMSIHSALICAEGWGQGEATGTEEEYGDYEDYFKSYLRDSTYIDVCEKTHSFLGEIPHEKVEGMYECIEKEATERLPAILFHAVEEIHWSCVGEEEEQYPYSQSDTKPSGPRKKRSDILRKVIRLKRAPNLNPMVKIQCTGRDGMVPIMSSIVYDCAINQGITSLQAGGKTYITRNLADVTCEAVNELFNKLEEPE